MQSMGITLSLHSLPSYPKSQAAPSNCPHRGQIWAKADLNIPHVCHYDGWKQKKAPVVKNRPPSAQNHVEPNSLFYLFLDLRPDSSDWKCVFKEKMKCWQILDLVNQCVSLKRRISPFGLWLSEPSYISGSQHVVCFWWRPNLQEKKRKLEWMWIG